MNEMTQWEYQVLVDSNIEKMNEYGKEGWEAINVNIPANGRPIVFFKRPLKTKDTIHG